MLIPIDPVTGNVVDPSVVAQQEARKIALLNSQLAANPATTAYEQEAFARMQLEKARQQRIEQERRLREMANASVQSMIAPQY